MLGQLMLVAAAIYGGLCLGLYLLQDRLVFLPSREVATTPARLGIEFEERWLTTEDGLRLHAWWIPVPENAATVLFLHGNAGNISHRLDTVSMLARMGFSVLILDYRGYGQSEGRPSEHGTYLDARAAFAHLTGELSVPAARIALFGRSLGGGVASWLAKREACAALVVESTFVSVPELGKRYYPIFPVSLLARIRYDAESEIRGARCPVLVVHSRDDEIVPFEHGKRLFEAAPEPKRFLEIRGDHNSGFLLSGEHYLRGLEGFLRDSVADLRQG